MSAVTHGKLANPFPGLRPFREEEEYLFFGREQQVDAMVDKLAATHFLAVVGTSGCGKSSLVNCGLRPALHRGLMGRAGSVWRVAYVRPGSKPIRTLAEALAASEVLGAEAPAVQSTEFTATELMESTLRMSTLGLLDAFEQARLDPRTNLLIVVDQFEELFRYQQLAGANGPARRGSEDAIAFVNLLLEVRAHANSDAGSRIYAVTTMRSDFLGDCSQFFGLPEAINQGQYLVPRMTREQRKWAIKGPVEVAGAHIDPVLLTRLANDVGDNPDQLSILQHALSRTWARWLLAEDPNEPLSLQHYEAVGTMAHALDYHAQEAYQALGDAWLQNICEKMFKALTDTANDARGIRRPTRFDTLCLLTAASPEQLTTVIDEFRQPSRSFLTPPLRHPLRPDTVIDISHESLMRVWMRLRQWGVEEAQSVQIYRRVAETAQLNASGKAGLLRNPDLQVALNWFSQTSPSETWAERYGPGFDLVEVFLRRSRTVAERERAEEAARQQKQAWLERAWLRYRRGRRGMTVAGIVLALVATLFYGLYRSAERERGEVERVNATLSAEKRRIESLLADSRRHGRELDFANELLKNAVEQRDYVPAGMVSVQAVVDKPRLIYLHIPDAGHARFAAAFAQQLEQQGYLPQPVERVVVGPAVTELRYFRTIDRGDAERLAGTLSGLGLRDVQTHYVPGFDAGRLEQLEVWFGPSDAQEITRLERQLNARSEQ
jgi:hypothetical protein